jgi:hypothetical protein
VASPLAHLSRADRDEFARLLGTKHAETFTADFGSLLDRLREVEPLTVLGSFATYGLVSTGIELREWEQERPILQHHVELLQAALLMVDTVADPRPANPRDLTEIDELLRSVSESFFLRRLNQLADADEEDRFKRFLVEDMRGQTQAVRNWGFANQIRRIVSEVFRPLDDAIERRMGVRVPELFEWHERVEDRVTACIQEHMGAGSLVYGASTLRQAVDAYLTSFPGAKDHDEIYDHLLKEKVPLRLAKMMLIAHSDLRLFTCYSFTLDEFVELYPREIEPEVLRDLLDGWSYAWKDLAQENPEHIFLGNPVWTRPIVRSGDAYFWPILGLFYSFAWELMQSLLTPEEREGPYRDSRSKYLESSLEQLVTEAFPDGRVFRGSRWTDPNDGKTYENDVLVHLDTAFLVIEAKSGTVTPSARRGGDLRLQEEVKELLLEPSLQGQRFAKYLLENRHEHHFETRSGKENVVDSRRIRTALPIAVTLESLAVLGGSMTLLEQAGFVGSDVRLSLSFALPDLEIIMDVLSSQAERLHYLRRRDDLERRLHYVGDELDLLALYVDTGFELAEIVDKEAPLILFGLSQDIEKHYLGKIHGEEIEKPRRRLRPLWERILSTLESRRFTCWTDASHILLHASFQTQREVETAVEKRRPAVLAGTLEPQFIFGAVGHSHNRLGLSFVLHPDMDRQGREAIGNEALGEALRLEGVTEALLLGLLASKPELPYSFLALGPPELFESMKE